MFHEIIRICPTASQNTYLYGIQLMQNFISTEKDEVQKQKYVDTLLMLYDKRYEIFGKPSKGETAFRKAGELMDYRPNNHSEIVKEYEIAAQNNYQAAECYVQMMQQIKIMYEKKQLDGETTIAKYEEILKNIDKLPVTEETEAARKTVEGIFLTMSELNSCENLIAMYTPKFKASPEDLDLIRGIRYRLSTTEGCRETQLFADVVEAGYRLEPNAESAYQLAQLFFIRSDKEKAMSYMKEAIEQEKEPLQKAKYMLQVANIHFQEGRINQAIIDIRQVIGLNSSSGEAYMILANGYAKLYRKNTECPFGGQEIFWVVVDLMQKAKSVDPSLSGAVNSAIAQYSKSFPSYQEIFLNEYTEGQSYTVNCNGVNGTTIIRAAPR
jgi:tetratricopeptide (TPR) repeat protein